ncbi:possible CobW protein involved in cobalamin synthesis [Pedobacter sp. BAL39]|uniref:CobW family GTP-binding protein n=1 Tax=Pedobacter sp. BAL39 TaxID=391596 RepID=UPI0001559F66|nr:GTP-binding protein [Pedobacter sp. BAL39]EDM35544.1 possible CobW protein involved in cobalamin synthesis [Pedobacter sp. BAL39]
MTDHAGTNSGRIKNVTILTGFLGAGKTTVLNAIIQSEKHIRYAVIENEIGLESIDAQLVVSSKAELIELNDGCLCCSLNGELIEALNTFITTKTDWDELIIEATGIADPANIAFPFLTEPSIQNFFNLSRVICVIDAELIEEQLKETTEAIAQISFADLLLINKTELITPGYLHILKGILSSINPLAVIMTTQKDHIDVKSLCSAERTVDFQRENHKETKGILNLSPGTTLPNATNRFAPLSIGQSHKQHQHSDIETITLRFDRPMQLQELEHRMRVFLFLQSAGVYRIKAIIHAAGYPQRIIMQSVGSRLSVSEGAAWATGEVRESKVVIIGKQLQIKGFDKIFGSCLAKNTP